MSGYFTLSSFLNRVIYPALWKSNITTLRFTLHLKVLAFNSFCNHTIETAEGCFYQCEIRIRFWTHAASAMDDQTFFSPKPIWLPELVVVPEYLSLTTATFVSQVLKTLPCYMEIIWLHQKHKAVCNSNKSFLFNTVYHFRFFMFVLFLCFCFSYASPWVFITL